MFEFLRVIGATVLTFMLLGGLACGSAAPDDYEKHDAADSGPVYFTAHRLVEDSEVILVAEFLSERDERVETRHPVTGAATGYRELVARTYRIAEAVKGNEQPGTEIVIRTGKRSEDKPLPGRPQFTRVYEQLPAEKGKTYVLFLRRYVGDDCRPSLSAPGEPWQAVLDGDSLRFQATSRYRETLRHHPNLTPMPGSDAPFELGLPELRRLTRALLYATPTPTPTYVHGPAINQLTSSAGSFFTAKPLVDASELIIVAEFVSERKEPVEVIYKGQFVGGIRDDVARTFRIRETIKGRQQHGEEIVVWQSRQYQELNPFRAMGATPPAGYTQPGASVFELPLVERGKNYVLFLRPFVYEKGTIWGWTGDPWLAELTGDSLKFQAVSWYKSYATRCGGKLAPGSDAPFELTLPELREIAKPR